MRKLLLVGTALAAMGLAMPAFAGNDSGGQGQQGWQYGNSTPTFEIAIAAALAGNSGSVMDNNAQAIGQGVGTTISGGSFNGANGVSATNQNAGANSALQNALSLAYIEGCSTCTTSTSSPTYTLAAGGALAVAGNSGEASGNTYTNSGGSVGATIDGSFNNVTGVFEVNQNSGANSLLQNSVAVASSTGLKGETDAGATVALAGNSGAIDPNNPPPQPMGSGSSYGAINSSFNGANGVITANQNVGANSLLQNASSLASLQFCNCATDNESLSVAAAGNSGIVSGNWASASNGSNGVSLTSSFQGAQGMMSVNQNAGTNSLLQNAVSVGVLTH